MSWLENIKNNHRPMFDFRAGDAVHPHDQFMDRTVLRIFPRSVTPNQITMLRFIFSPLVFLLIFTGHYFIGTIIFLLVAFTDAIDGSMARTRNQVTEFGILMDPLADKFLIGGMVLLIVFKNYSPYLGLVILALELVFIVTALIAKYRFKTVRMANLWGKIKMILQVIAVFATLLALLLDFPVFLTIGSWLFGLAIGFAIISLFAHGI